MGSTASEGGIVTGSRFIIYAARAGAKSFFEGISDPTFFMTINKILDNSYYKQYEDPKHGEVFTFESLRDFVVHPEGLDIPDWLPFMKALQAQDNGSAAKDLYWRMVKFDEMLDPLVGSEHELGPTVKVGMPSPNLAGRRGKEQVADWPLVSNRLSSNSQVRIVRRLKRDHPELAQSLARGEFDSARAAGIAAGFVKPSPPSLQLKDPAPTAQKLLAKKGKAWCLQLLEELSGLLEEPVSE
jgi:hypothetical protein